MQQNTKKKKYCNGKLSSHSNSSIEGSAFYFASQRLNGEEKVQNDFWS